MLQGFRKVDHDRWEFANEGFLRGQKHLLKNIKRRRNVTQNIQQGGACVELGHYGSMDGEIETLNRDRNLLMAELVKLRQQQQSSREQLMVMESRLGAAERKQQQMMRFLAKALSTATFTRNMMQHSEQRSALRSIEIGRKRRLTTSPSVAVESQMESLFSAALDDESSSDVKEPKPLENVGEMNWEELLSESLIGGAEEEESLADLPAEESVPEPSNWGQPNDKG